MKNILETIYRTNTDGVEISVEAEYIDSQTSNIGNLFVWAYHVKINNKTSESLQLVSRHWKIIDEKGVTQEVSGEGVIGEKPVIAPNSNFQYSSGVHLRYPSGIMAGHYDLKKENGEILNAKIPTFSLDVPNLKSTVN